MTKWIIPEVSFPTPFTRLDSLFAENYLNKIVVDGFPQQSYFGALLRKMVDSLMDAAISLTLYQDAVARLELPPPDREVRDEARRKRFLRLKEIESELPREKDNNDFELISEVRRSAERKYDREKWNLGEIPHAFEGPLAGIYARSFVYAIRMLEELLVSIKNELKRAQREWSFISEVEEERRDVERAITKIDELIKEFADKFPALKEVRDSSVHISERIRNQGWNKSTRKMEPIPADGPPYFRVFGTMSETEYRILLLDGSTGVVSVTEKSLEKAQSIVQKSIDIFDWVGPKIPMNFPISDPW